MSRVLQNHVYCLYSRLSIRLNQVQISYSLLCPNDVQKFLLLLYQFLDYVYTPYKILSKHTQPIQTTNLIFTDCHIDHIGARHASTFLLNFLHWVSSRLGIQYVTCNDSDGILNGDMTIRRCIRHVLSLMASEYFQQKSQILLISLHQI